MSEHTAPAAAEECAACSKCRIRLMAAPDDTCDICGTGLVYGRPCVVCTAILDGYLKCPECGRQYEWHDEPVLLLTDRDIAALRTVAGKNQGKPA